MLDRYIKELETYSINKKLNFYYDTSGSFNNNVNFDFVDIQTNAFKVDFNKHTLCAEKSLVYSHLKEYATLGRPETAHLKCQVERGAQALKKSLTDSWATLVSYYRLDRILSALNYFA